MFSLKMAGPMKRAKLTDTKISRILKESDSDNFDLESVNSDDENAEIANLHSVSESESEASSDSDEDGEESDTATNKWYNVDGTFQPKTFPFAISNPGPRTNLNSDSSAAEFFQLFFTDELIKTITHNTNAYAQKKLDEMRPLSEHSTWRKWTPASVEEMRAFLGVIVNMGLHGGIPMLEEYFSQAWECQIPFLLMFFQKLVSYNCFGCSIPVLLTETWKVLELQDFKKFIMLLST